MPVVKLCGEIHLDNDNVENDQGSIVHLRTLPADHSTENVSSKIQVALGSSTLSRDVEPQQ